MRGGGVMALLEVLGWMTVAGAVVVGLVAASDGAAAQNVISLVVSGGVGGLILVGLAQMGAAMLRAAQASEQILARLQSVDRASAAPPTHVRSPMFDGHLPAAPPRAPAGASRSLVKVYKKQAIEKTPFGFQVGDKVFQTVTEAERFIDRPSG